MTVGGPDLRRIALFLLTLWALAGVVLLLLQEEREGTPGAAEIDPAAPTLETRGRRPSPAATAQGPAEIDIDAAVDALLGTQAHPRAWDPAQKLAEIERILRAGDGDALQVLRLLGRLRAKGQRAAAAFDILLSDYERTPSGTWRSVRTLRTLLAIAPDDPRLRPLLRSAMGSPDARTRLMAQGALLKGPTEDILALLEDAPASARLNGATILMNRGVEKERVREHVLVALQRGDLRTRTRAIKLLGKLGGDVRDVLPIVEELLSSEDKGRWLSAVQALGALATVPGEKEPVIRRLLEVGRRPDVQVRTAAVQAILMHDAQPAPVIELLTYLLDDAEADVRAEAVDALGELSARHETAKRAVERARTDPSPKVRELVVYWLEEDEDD